MPLKIYHKDQGFVLTSDSSEIEAMLAKGGKLITCDQDIIDIKRMNHPHLFLDEKPEEIEQPEPAIEPQNPIIKQRGRPRKWP